MSDEPPPPVKVQTITPKHPYLIIYFFSFFFEIQEQEKIDALIDNYVVEPGKPLDLMGKYNNTNNIHIL